MRRLSQSSRRCKGLHGRRLSGLAAADAGCIFTLPIPALNLCSMNVLIWFKRDLRTLDHPALSHAAGLGAVLPLYIVEPDYWAQPDTSARQWGFTAECLEDLRQQLGDLGAPLLVRVGEAQAVLARLCRQHNITRIVSHAEPAAGFAAARDQRIADWAQAAGIIWDQLPSADFSTPALPAPALAAVPGLEPGLIPTARALRLGEDRCAHRQHGGRAQALDLLETFLSHRGETYRSASGSPLLAERACSRLSPHLAQGSLSRREVAQAVATRLEGRPAGLWGGALAGFQSRVGLRDQPHAALGTPPQCPRPVSATAELLRQNSAAARLAAWQRAETGLPFLDACLRYLAATGWLNFRMRALVVACAGTHLRLDWQAAGEALAARLTDYDPAIHWPQVQRLAADGRAQVCNPVMQGRALDPTGTFTRRWLPELAVVPDADLHAPWRWPGAGSVLGRRYPEPIVDLVRHPKPERRLPQRAPTPRAMEVIEAAPPRCRYGQLSLDL